MSPVLSGFQPPNSTQVLLQSSSTRSWLKPHPPINELAIVTALSWQLLTQTKIKASPLEMGAMQGERTVFSTCCAQEDSCGPVRVNQGISKVEPRDGHAVCTLWPPPPIPPFLLKQNLSPEVVAGHKMKVSCWIYPATSRKGLIKNCVEVSSNYYHNEPTCILWITRLRPSQK